MSRRSTDSPEKLVDPTERWTPQQVADSVAGLSDQQLLVLRAIANGDTNGEIAFRLGRAEKTVEKTIYDLFRKLGFRSRIDAAVFYTLWASRKHDLSHPRASEVAPPETGNSPR